MNTLRRPARALVAGILPLFILVLPCRALALENQGTTVKRDANGCSIVITVQVAVSGGTDAQFNAVKTALQNCFATGCQVLCDAPNTGGCAITVTVDVKKLGDIPVGDQGKYHKVTMVDAGKTSLTRGGTPNGASGTGDWAKDASAEEYCHECGHLCGLGDKYCGKQTENLGFTEPVCGTKLPDPCDCAPAAGQKRCTKPCNNTNANDVMAALTAGNKISCTQILKIVEAAGMLSCPKAPCCTLPPPCPGSNKIEDLENPSSPFHPPVLASVCASGIITGFDANPSAYAFYIQNAFADGAHPWSGIQAFTGAFNYNASLPGTPTGGNLAIGDSVIVYGRTQEFPASNGTSEIEGPDGIQSTNDMVVWKKNSGNLVPAFHVGTTHELNWIAAISAPTAEPWEGCLVKINGPLRVGRNTGSPLSANTFLLVSSLSPSDTVLVDGNTLTTFGAPPVGTNIDFVQGILNQNTTSGVNSYRIQLRNSNDIAAAAPPNLVDAYPIEDNQIRLIFDKSLDPPSAQTPSHYSLGSGISGSIINTATMASPTTVVLQINSVLVDGDYESVSASGIGAQTCPSCLMSSQTLNFVNGVIPIAMVQGPDPAFLHPCDDRSRYAGPGASLGTRLTTRGIAVQSYSGLYYIEDPTAQRSGVSVFGPLQPLVNGHRYRIAGRVQEFAGETEITSTVDVLDEGAVAAPTPLVSTVHTLSDTTCDATQSLVTGEDFEGVLVHVDQVRVVAFNTPPTDPVAGGAFRVVQPTGPTAPDTILVSALGGRYTFDANPGMVVNVTGVLHFDTGTYRILPRSDADITLSLSSVDDSPASGVRLLVSPNPGTTSTVSFTIPAKAEVDLGIYDLQGRRVTQLFRGVLEAGTHTRQWDGHDASGRSVGAGIYYYRLRVGAKVWTSRGVRLE
jgi:hypothetical protein